MKAGDVVRYHKQNPHLDALGFVLGQHYEVTGRPSHLNVKTSNGHYVYLADGKGPTNVAQNFIVTTVPKLDPELSAILDGVIAEHEKRIKSKWGF